MNGVLVLDKPQGFTSFDAVAKLRGILGEKRIGHSGTLDPMATGVLPIFVGKATKAISLLTDTRKAYVARVKSGLCTDTADITGKTQRECPPIGDPALLQSVLSRFSGVISQIPPMYSAVSVGGKRLYDLAREGKTVERAPRRVEIFSIAAGDFDNGDFTLEVACSGGTYIRTLAEDICRAAGSEGCLSALRRTRSGRFTLDDCVDFDYARERGENALLPVETVFSDLPKLYPAAKEQRLFINGVRLEIERFTNKSYAQGERFAVCADDYFAVAELRGGLLEKLAAF